MAETKRSKYYCEHCQVDTRWKSKWNLHLVTNTHKRQTLQILPRLYKCPECNLYKNYNHASYMAHFRRCKLKKTTLIISEIAPTPKKDETIKDVEILMMEINKLLNRCKEEKQNPNKFFNYGYYCANLKNLNINELNDFYQELKYIFK